MSAAARFRRILSQLAADGETEVTADRLVHLWQEEVGPSETTHRPRVARLIGLSIEWRTLERIDHGRYRVTIAPHAE